MCFTREAGSDTCSQSEGRILSVCGVKCVCVCVCVCVCERPSFPDDWTLCRDHLSVHTSPSFSTSSLLPFLPFPPSVTSFPPLFLVLVLLHSAPLSSSCDRPPHPSILSPPSLCPLSIRHVSLLQVLVVTLQEKRFVVLVPVCHANIRTITRSDQSHEAGSITETRTCSPVFDRKLHWVKNKLTFCSCGFLLGLVLFACVLATTAERER